MPNWCSTNLVFFTKEPTPEAKKQITDFYDLIDDLWKKVEAKEIENYDWDGVWLGNLVTALGADWNKVPCRGCINWQDSLDEELDGGSHFYLDTDDAWGPQKETWDEAIKKYPLLDYYFVAEEPGCDVFINTDKKGWYFPWRYAVDTYSESDLYETAHEYLDTEEETIKYVDKHFGPVKSLDDIDKLFKELEEKDGGMFRLHAFTTE